MVAFLFSGKGRVRRRTYAIAGLLLVVSPLVFALLGLACIHVMDARIAVLAPNLHDVFQDLVVSTLESFGRSTSRNAVAWAQAAAIYLPLLAIGALAASWSFFALTAKRLHDVGWSGWLAALVILPGLGAWMIYLVMILVPGQAGGNRYGADPKLL